VVDKIGQALIVPEVGMAFDSYAGKIGFSIRKNHSNLQEDKTIYQNLEKVEGYT